MWAGAHEHSFSHSAELLRVTGEIAVHEYRRSLGSDFEFNFRSDGGELSFGIFVQFHCDDQLFPGLDNESLSRVKITRLSKGDFVLSGEKHYFLLVFQLGDVAEVLAIDPDSRGFLGFRGADKLEFALDRILSSGYDR